MILLEWIIRPLSPISQVEIRGITSLYSCKKEEKKLVYKNRYNNCPRIIIFHSLCIMLIVLHRPCAFSSLLKNTPYAYMIPLLTIRSSPEILGSPGVHPGPPHSSRWDRTVFRHPQLIPGCGPGSTQWRDLGNSREPCPRSRLFSALHFRVHSIVSQCRTWWCPSPRASRSPALKLSKLSPCKAHSNRSSWRNTRLRKKAAQSPSCRKTRRRVLIRTWLMFPHSPCYLYTISFNKPQWLYDQKTKSRMFSCEKST